MPVYKDEKTKKWFVKRRYKDWLGDTKSLTKRGFALRREAVEWERNFLSRHDSRLNMSFKDFYEVYKENISSRLKDSTWETKESIIKDKILPFFGDLQMRNINSINVIHWQNEMMKARQPNDKPYSQTYLNTIHNQLSAIFNHAMRHYKLAENPARIAGAIGDKDCHEMQFGTKEEYLLFSKAIIDKPCSFYCFEMLYWCGIREGELLALTMNDFNFKEQYVSITKTYHKSKGKEIITAPKTKDSIRDVSMPDFLCKEMKEYFSSSYDLRPADRVFPVSKHFLSSEIIRGAAVSGIKRIRVHDLRHSHVSLLIHMGYSAVAIAKRVGHKSIDITYRYAHLFPSVQADIANKLNSLKEDTPDTGEPPTSLSLISNNGKRTYHSYHA